MSTIKSCTVTIAPYSAVRKGKKRLSRKDAVRALIDGADLRIFNCNGVPCDSYCSVRDMAVDCSIELREGADFLTCFRLTAGEKAVTAKAEQHDIPDFMVGHPVELD